MVQDKSFPLSQEDISSGKTARSENFPVVSWLAPVRLRPHIAAFYAYARSIDDVADSPLLDVEDKITRLDTFARVVRGENMAGADYETARHAYRSLTDTGITSQHCVDLTIAFKQDAQKLRYADWDELMGYCNFSAAPVGRYMIDLHRESTDAYPSSDALCNALQVLNHVQDCGDDYRQLGRVYLPDVWLNAEGATVEMLGKKYLSASLRRVLDRCLNRTDELLVRANELPYRINRQTFSIECATIVDIAHGLSAELRRRDPLAERVVLSTFQYMTCFARGIYRVLRR